ncbi:MAG: low temperature requirement protein A [Acidimicrobiia bacterium]|nr:low temperature requirement protein A [Acidimicrobiia bacterium]
MSTDNRIDPKAMLGRFRAIFWQRPRRHGEVIEDRTVSFLELFYDLVYVVLIAQATHTLAHHISWRGFGEFAVVFGLIWIAWLNGTLIHELHGREDARSRTFIFIQMLLLATLAVFAGDAAGEGGDGFAVTYTLLLLVLTWLWYAVRRVDTEEYEPVTRRYLLGMVAAIVVMVVSIFLTNEARVVVWAIFVVGFVISGILQVSSQDWARLGFSATESMVERFGLFTIIVLGEVVVGVVDGLSEVERTARTVATGLIGLTIGFGFWWTYFDFVGRRMPRSTNTGMAQWSYAHLPVSLAIAASGAAMVSLVEHAGDERASEPATWLLAGSVALMLLSLILIMRALQDHDRFIRVYQPVGVATAAGAGVALLIGLWRPSPILLVLAIAVIPAAIWWFAVDRWLRHGRVGSLDHLGDEAT